MNIFSMLKETFTGFNVYDKKADEKTDDEQPDTTDMLDLESEESAEQKNQKGQGLKTKKLTPNQMLSRLPISSAQLKAGNN